MKCPECSGTKLNKFGFKFVGKKGKRRRAQQYQCGKCGRITIYPK